MNKKIYKITIKNESVLQKFFNDDSPNILNNAVDNAVDTVK